MKTIRRRFVGNEPAPVGRCTDCSFAVRGRRRIETVRKWYWPTTAIWEVFEFDGDRCPTHGTLLVAECDSRVENRLCAAPIMSPSDVRCRMCGRPYRWAVMAGRERQVQHWSSPGRRVGAINDCIELYVVHGSIVEIAADAVVSCDNADGEMASTSAAALSERGGSEIEEESMLALHELGTAWLTSPGRLAVTHVIHVGVLQEDETTTGEFTTRAITDCVRRAREARTRTIAMPPIGVKRGLSAAESVKAMVAGFRAAGSGSPLQIAFVLHGREEFITFREELRNHLTE